LSRLRHRSALLIALMFGITSVAEGYPSSGWAALLQHLPLFIALLICLASSSWLLGSIVWLAFFAFYPRPSLMRRWQWILLLAPVIVFVPPMAMSAIAMIDAPAALILQPVQLAHDLGGLAP